MNIKAVANNSLEKETDLSNVLPSIVFIVVGNLLTIVLFAVNRRLRKESLFVVINMAFADLMLGTLTLPLYIYHVGKSLQLRNGGWLMPLTFFYVIVDTRFSPIRR